MSNTTDMIKRVSFSTVIDRHGDVIKRVASATALASSTLFGWRQYKSYGRESFFSLSKSLQAVRDNKGLYAIYLAGVTAMIAVDGVRAYRAYRVSQIIDLLGDTVVTDDEVRVVRVLVAPCGHIAGMDLSDDVPGFCRTEEEALEDSANGFSVMTMPLDTAKTFEFDSCTHNPKWGVVGYDDTDVLEYLDAQVEAQFSAAYELCECDHCVGNLYTNDAGEKHYAECFCDHCEDEIARYSDALTRLYQRYEEIL